MRAGYYLASKSFLSLALAVGMCAIALTLVGTAVAQTPSSTPAASRGEAYEKCKSSFAGPVQQFPDSEESNTFLVSCGWKFYDFHEFQEAGQAFTQAVAMAERRGDRAKLADALDGNGNVHREHSDFAGAEQLLKHALAIAEQNRDNLELSKVYNSFSRVSFDQGKVSDAHDYLELSVKFAQQARDPLRLAVANNNLGTYFIRRGDYAQALSHFQQSLTALRQIDEELKSAVVLDNIGQCYWHLGDLPKALETIQQGLAIREKYRDVLMVAKSLDSLGNIYLSEDNYSAALEAQQKALELRSKAGVPYQLAESLNNVAAVYESQGEYAQAAAYLRRALGTERKFGNKDLKAEIETHLGNVYLRQGKTAAAQAALRDALKNSRAAGDNVEAAEAQYALGRLYEKTGRLLEAEAILNEARQYFESARLAAELGNTLVELADVERRRGNLQQSLQLAAGARDLGERVGLPELQWRTLTTLGRLNTALGHRDEAAKSFEDAIAVIEGLRTRVAGGEEDRARYFAERVAPYQERIALALAAGKTGDALDYAERSKARVLVDVIGADRVPLTAAIDENERKREATLRGALASLNSQLMTAAQANPPDEKLLASLKQQRVEARLRYEDFESTLYANHPELAVSRGTLPVVRAGDIAALLPSRSAAVMEFAVVRRRTWAFVMTARGLHAFELPLADSELRVQVERFRRQLASRDLRIGETAQHLYQQVLQPANAWLKAKTEIVFIPDGVLWDLPFQALQPRPGHYLVEDSAISYAPSLTALREMMRRRSPGNHQATLLAFGNPIIGAGVVRRRKVTLMGEPLSPLPDAEIQAKAVAEIYRPDSRVYVEGEASEDRFKAEAPRYRILHLATHGVLDNRSPLYSYLVLSPSEDPRNPENGLLEAWEIMRMRLNADLVVLSACETARGKVSAGEAMIGLTWAFLVAGAPATVVSQWKVESASSSALMTDFHQRWLGGRSGLSKAEALQQAAVKMLRSRDYSHPFYWAGYILVGNGR